MSLDVKFRADVRCLTNGSRQIHFGAQYCIERLMSDLTDWEAQKMANLESCGIRVWMG